MSFTFGSQFKPAGDQPLAIAGLVKSLRDQRRYQTLLGVTGSGKTFTMASVIAELDRPTLIMCHNKTLAAQLAGEFQSFFPDNAVHYFVSYYDYYQPEAYIARSDTFIEKETQINEEIDRLRNAATQSLLTRRDVIIVASVSCIYGLGNPDNYLDLVIELQIGQAFKRDKLLRRLTDLQFSRNDFDLKRATFRAQGDTVEIIQASDDTTLRLTFFGDEIEQIERRDSLTGDIIEQLKSVKIFPAKHFVTPEDKVKAAAENIRQELNDRLVELRAEGKILEAARLEQRTNFDLELLANTGFVAGIENYSRHLDNRSAGDPPSTLIDYFPDDFLLFIDESHQTVPQIGAMYSGDRSRKQTLVDYGFRLPSALDNRPLQFHEFEDRTGQTIFVSATPGPFELEKTLSTNHRIGSPQAFLPAATAKTSVVEQINRPTGLLDPTIEIQPIEHQVDHLMEAIKIRVSKGERVLVTTLSKRMAEELATYFTEAGIKSQYLHSELDAFERLERLRDLRLGIYDVVIGINLLREGLDLPEVSLVAILDADKEGFLRSLTAFMQIIGRAARHEHGHAILYANRITKAMQAAIDETGRRRRIQHEYNQAHGITPKSVTRAIGDSRLNGVKTPQEDQDPHSQVRVDKLSDAEFRFYLKELEDRMDLASDNLEFEQAAKLRDRIGELKQLRKIKSGK